ncbi:DMT family transporter [Paenibacillus sp. P26]|nr:DMT family transporter [Paenibacillus sp. P26]
MWFVYAAASAVCFGLRGILYQWTSQRPINRNLLLFGVYLSGTLIALASAAATRRPWTPAVGIGSLMGLFSFVANASMYKGYAVGKTSIIAMFTALPPLVVVILAFFLWGEKLNLWQGAAFLIVVAGSLMIRYSGDLSMKHLQGVQWGVLAMLFFGLTDLTSKQATLSGAANLPVLTLMYATGTLAVRDLLGTDRWRDAKARLVLKSAARETAASEEDLDMERRAGNHEGFAESAAETAGGGTKGTQVKPENTYWPPLRTLLWGMFVGITNIGGMMLVMPAFKLGVTGLVSVVIASNVVLVLLYARLVLKEKFSRLEAGGLVMALIGIVVIRLAAG